jgi:hypothetical protein
MASKNIRPAREYEYPLLTLDWAMYLDHTQNCTDCKAAFKLHNMNLLCEYGTRLAMTAKKSS